MEKISFKLTFLVVLMIVAYGTTIFELPSAEAYTGGLPIRCAQDSDCSRNSIGFRLVLLLLGLIARPFRIQQLPHANEQMKKSS
ncbi:hypothetical protein WN944_022807 [Citrus x changshan-huyou]|uniref:Uncharacterized protein n=1 Tax=Citrus x changshan-huyou TaxID=2935761 RepID=A0AAP0N1S4_9ROSI